MYIYIYVYTTRYTKCTKCIYYFTVFVTTFIFSNNIKKIDFLFERHGFIYFVVMKILTIYPTEVVFFSFLEKTYAKVLLRFIAVPFFCCSFSIKFLFES